MFNCWAQAATRPYYGFAASQAFGLVVVVVPPLRTMFIYLHLDMTKDSYNAS